MREVCSRVVATGVLGRRNRSRRRSNGMVAHRQPRCAGVRAFNVSARGESRQAMGSAYATSVRVARRSVANSSAMCRAALSARAHTVLVGFTTPLVAKLLPSIT